MTVMDPERAGPRSADSPRLLREINDQLVLKLFLDYGPMTRGRVGELTGLSKPTVSALLARLSERGLVTTTGVVAGGPGPNARIYAVNAAAGHVIGVHVEQHGSVAGLAGLTGEIRATHAVEVRQRRDSSPLTELTAAVDGVLEATGLARDAVHQVVVATPGVIDPVTGSLRHARHIRGWEAPGLHEQMSERLGIPVSHGNDVNLAAVAEGLVGAAQASSDYALLWLDRGVGLGLVLGGALRTGAHGGAGEIGYLPVPGVDRHRVDRGAAGGFQQLVGGQGIRAMARRHGIRGETPAAIVAKATDRRARRRRAAGRARRRHRPGRDRDQHAAGPGAAGARRTRRVRGRAGAARPGRHAHAAGELRAAPGRAVRTGGRRRAPRCHRGGAAAGAIAALRGAARRVVHRRDRLSLAGRRSAGARPAGQAPRESPPAII